MRHHATYDKKGVTDKYPLLIIIRDKPQMWKSYIQTFYLCRLIIFVLCEFHILNR